MGSILIGLIFIAIILGIGWLVEKKRSNSIFKPRPQKFVPVVVVIACLVVITFLITMPRMYHVLTDIP